MYINTVLLTRAFQRLGSGPGYGQKKVYVSMKVTEQTANINPDYFNNIN
jgi:hypothetical protein